MGRKLSIYMLDGAATGPKTIEIGNWSGKAIFSPRASLKALLNRSEFNFPGVYLLQSNSPSFDYDGSVYIGEAEELRSRLRTHIAERDFESIICFISKDEMLTKSHIKYLEARLLQLAKEANNSFVENTNSTKGARISEADISDMEYFIEQVCMILPTVGVNTFVVAAPHVSQINKSSIDKKKYQIKSKTYTAAMIELDGSFLVLSGSEASLTTSKSISSGWLKIRKKLFEAGIIKQQNEKLVFVEDASFSSPSAASSVILGRQAPGPISWIDEQGRTYKAIQEEQPH